MKRVLAIAFAAIFLMAASDDPAEYLKDPSQEARAKALFYEVRCVVCQNENIGGSEAPIAHDLRTLVREQIAAGKSDKQVRDYLLNRYGEFILLKPRFNARTALLWSMPFAIVLIGGALIVMGRRKADLTVRPSVEDLTDDELKTLKQLQENSHNTHAK